MQWLERKLTYNYYDPTNEKWWVNVIHVKENGAYTIKNIAVKHPKNVTKKTYHQRTFFMWDLNPRTVTISDVPSDLGRFVKGKLIRLEGFKGEKKVGTKKNGRRGSRVSYIHISIPAFLEDSVQEYSMKVKEKLAAAISLNARLFKTSNKEDNINATFNTFKGSYVSEDSTSYMNFEKIAAMLVRFTIRENSRIQVGTIGYEEERNSIFYFRASSEGYLIRQLKFDEKTRNLILKDDEGDSIYVIGRNTIEFSINGEKIRFFRQ